MNPARRASMARTSFSDFACSAARALDAVGEWWTPLILRDVFLGLTRFDLIQRDLGIPRKVLTDRLADLVEQGVLERVAYVAGRTRHEYRLTERGRDFVTTLIALMNWGDRWTGRPDAPPLLITHERCGGAIVAALNCECCGEKVQVEDIATRPGPGAQAVRGTSIVGRAGSRD